MENFINILLIVICYLIGSIPTAYLMLKWQKNIDITKAGSGNVGTRNYFEVSKNKSNTLLVLLLDLLKGIIPLVIAINIFGYHGFYLFIFALSIVFGHNFSIFIKFKGGRGLATAAGANLVLFPVAVPIWLMLYFVSSRAITKNTHLKAIIATVVLPIFIFSTPSQVNIYILNMFHDVHVEYWEFALYNIVLTIIILLKHIEPIVSLIKEKMKNSKEQKNV